MSSKLFHHRERNIFKCVFMCSYLRAVVIISALTMDSRESNVTLLSTYNTKRFTFTLNTWTCRCPHSLSKLQYFAVNTWPNISFQSHLLWFIHPLTWICLHTCVCPLWNRAEPCSGLKRSTSQEMLLKAVSSLPSHLQHKEHILHALKDCGTNIGHIDFIPYWFTSCIHSELNCEKCLCTQCWRTRWPRRAQPEGTSLWKEHNT